jgi:hypothetical protein
MQYFSCGYETNVKALIISDSPNLLHFLHEHLLCPLVISQGVTNLLGSRATFVASGQTNTALSYTQC